MFARSCNMYGCSNTGCDIEIGGIAICQPCQEAFLRSFEPPKARHVDTLWTAKQLEAIFFTFRETGDNVSTDREPSPHGVFTAKTWLAWWREQTRKKYCLD